MGPTHMETDSYSLHSSSWKGENDYKIGNANGCCIVNCAKITQIVIVIDESVTAFLFQKGY